MKKLILLIGLFAFYQISFGQCDKSITFKCVKARGLENGSVGQEGQVDATISIDNGKITLIGTMNGETETMEGEITEVSICKWSGFLKDGKTQYKALTRKEGQSSENTLIDIESGNGYTTITFGSDPDTGSKLQFDVAEYTIADGENINSSPNKPVGKKKKQKRKSKANIG